MCKALLTKLARVWPFPGMRSHVYLQRLVLGEFSAAHCTHEALDAHMAENMSLEVALQ